MNFRRKTSAARSYLQIVDFHVEHPDTFNRIMLGWLEARQGRWRNSGAAPVGLRQTPTEAQATPHPLP